jgi:hypothetical protein
MAGPIVTTGRTLLLATRFTEASIIGGADERRSAAL